MVAGAPVSAEPFSGIGHPVTIAGVAGAETCLRSHFERANRILGDRSGHEFVALASSKAIPRDVERQSHENSQSDFGDISAVARENFIR
jgi:hypothetical protein